MKKLLLLFFLMTISLGQSQNLITNGDFANGTTGWVFGAPGTVASGEAFYSTSNAAGNPWDTELKQTGKSFTGGARYTLTFRARAAANRNISVNIQNTGIWNDQFRNDAVALTTTMTTYTFTFNATSTNTNAQLNFHMANIAGTNKTAAVYFDDVSIVLAPTLSAFSVPAKLLGNAAFNLTAPTTNSGGEFTYTSSNTGVATISASTVTIVGVGTSTITANQAANGSFGAGSITASFVVTGSPLPTIGALSLPNKETGDAPFGLSDPSSNSNGAFTYASSNSAVATISGSTVTIVGAGTSTITATQAATGSYDTGSVSAILNVGEPKTLLLGFETGESGNTNGPFGTMALPVAETGTGSNTSKVLKIVTNAGGAIWQGTNFVLTRPVKLTTTKTMTIDVLSDTPITFLMKVNGGVAGALEAAAQASHNGNGTWQTISFTFNTSLDGKAATANGVYTTMVLHPFFPFSGSPSTKTFYIDNIKGPLSIVAPTLSNFSISAKTVGNSFELTAPTTNSDGAFTYTSSNNAIATVSGSTVNVVGPGSVIITANQAAGTYNSSGTITATFTASSLAIPSISAFTVPAKVLGDAAFSLTAPTSTSGGAFTFTSSNTAVATISGTTVTIVGVGTSTITANQAITASYEAGSTTASFVVSYASPAVAATTPTLEATDVISIFSGAYTNILNTDFFPNWGQSTQYAPVNVNGNPTIKYSNLTYQGITFASPINASAMESLHIDIWTPNCTSFDVYVLDAGNDPQKVTLTPSLNGWNSYDINLAAFTALDKAATKELKIQSSVLGSIVYLDNIYFWKLPVGTFTYYADADGDTYGAGAAVLLTATTAPAGYSVNNTDCNDSVATSNPGASEVLNGIDDDCDGLVDDGVLPTIPTTDAPTPISRNAWDVQSVYSSAYTNYSGVNVFANWSQTTTFSYYTPVSNETLKYSNLTYQGIEFNGAKNVLAMTTLHLDVWTPDITSFKVFLVAGGESAVTLTPTQSGWNSFDINLATQYAGRNLLTATALKLERTLWTPTDGNVNSLYVDNIYFYRPATTQPPTLGSFTVPAKILGNGAFNLTLPTTNSTGAFTITSSDTNVATIIGKRVTIVGVGTATITATQAARGGYSSGSAFASLVVSYPGPTTAPAKPTKDSSRVISVFSDQYSNVTGTGFFQQWGSGTTGSTIQIETNNIQKYANFSYVGTQFASPIDASSMEMLHLDIWTPDCTAFKVSLISNGENAITLTPTLSGWNSFDIDLSLYSAAGRNLAAIGQFKFERDGSGTKTVYLDNIYFHNNRTKVSSFSCGKICTSVNDSYIHADVVPLATGYKFEVSNGSEVRTIETTLRYFNLMMLSGSSYSTTYSIRVSSIINGVYSPYGVACSATTPANQGLTKVSSLTCGNTLSQINSYIHANKVFLATHYSFKVVNGSIERIIETTNRYFNLSQLEGGALYNTAYTISVATKYNNVLGEYGDECTVTTPGNSDTSKGIQQSKAIEANEVSVKVYPNPFTTNFKLDFSSSSESNVEIVVYDMIGRQLERLQVESSEMNNMELGINYPSGVYNVIVKQGEDVKTLRVVKR